MISDTRPIASQKLLFAPQKHKARALTDSKSANVRAEFRKTLNSSASAQPQWLILLRWLKLNPSESLLLGHNHHGWTHHTTIEQEALLHGLQYMVIWHLGRWHGTIETA